MQDELERLKGKKVDKKQRLDQLETRASALLSQIRRDLGGQYVESLEEINVDRARDSIGQLAEVKREAKQLESEIEEIEEILET
jgi:hypothetical protein